MRMTIDEAIIQARIQLTIWKEGCESKLDNSSKAVETLIEIARKYQKIEQIIRNYDVALESHNMKSTIDKIREVVDNNNE